MVQGIGVKCLFCDNYITLTNIELERLDRGLPIGSKVCDECIDAVAYAKKMMKDSCKQSAAESNE